MPYIEVWVEPEVEFVGRDLSEYSDEELREELRSRLRNRSGGGNPSDYSIPQGVAEVTLAEAAEHFRKSNRYDMAFRLDEIRADFIGN